jgi:nicotinamidase-related amidase
MNVPASAPDPAGTALLTIDLQNDFLHPEGAYGRAGQTAPALAALPGVISPLALRLQQLGGWYISAQFTLVPGRNGEPLISPHLKVKRPFLGKGDFLPGSWGHALVDALPRADVVIEKVAYSAFFQSRLEFVLKKLGISSLLVGGIVTNGGVASTVRDAHVRDLEVTVLADGCAAFSLEAHRTALEDMKTVATIRPTGEVLARLGA